MCAGCGDSPIGSCGNDAFPANNGTGHGLGLQACITRCSHDSSRPECAGPGTPRGLGASDQLFNFTVTSGLRYTLQGGGVTGTIQNVRNGHYIQRALGGGGQVVLAPCSGTSDESPEWIATPAGSKTAAGAWPFPAQSSAWPSTTFQLAADRSLCLSSGGAAVVPAPDPWCVANNNMWRSNTDVLQSWTRTMIEVESMATQVRSSAVVLPYYYPSTTLIELESTATQVRSSASRDATGRSVVFMLTVTQACLCLPGWRRRVARGAFSCHTLGAVPGRGGAGSHLPARGVVLP